MKPSRNLLSSVIVFSMTSQLLQGAADITISNGGNSDITPTTPFMDLTDNGGGPSNLNVTTLVGALGAGPAVVDTFTTTGSGPFGGRITVVDSITWTSLNSLSLKADGNIEVGATITNNAGGGLSLTAGSGVAFNADVILSGGVSVVSSGVTQAVTRKLLIGGLADFNAGAGPITLDQANEFGSLKLTGGGVVIHEIGDSVLAGVSAGSLSLTATGTITDTGNIGVTGATTLSGTSINLGGAGRSTTVGSLNFTSPGPVTVQLDAGTSLTGANTASVFTLGVTGTANFAAGATLTATTLNIQNGTVALSGNNLVDSMNVINAGSLTANGADIVNAYTQNGSGILAGGSTLTATGGATLNGGSVTGNLLGNAAVAGTVGISGSVGGGFLRVDSGTLTFSGTSTSAPVTIAALAALTDTGNLSNTAAVTNAGLFTVNATDTVGTYTQNGSAILAGSAALTATTATLNGGSVTGSLLGNTTVAGTVGISGSVGGGLLHVDSGALTFSGTSTSTPVTIAALAALTDTGNLSNTAAVTNAGLFTVNANDTVGTYTQNGSAILAGSAALTATTATLNGGSVTGNLLGNTTVAGTVGISGSVGGGFLHVDSGALTFSGTSTSTPVTIAALAALTDTGNLSNTAAVTNAGLFTVNVNDTIGTYTQNGSGILAGSAALTATTATLNGGSVTVSLLGNTTVAGTVGISGSVGGGFLHVDGGTLTFSGTSTSAPVTIAALAALTDTGNLSNTAAMTNAGLFTVNANDTISTYTQNGAGILAGSAALTATGGATLNGGTVSGHLLGDTTSTGSVLIDTGATVGGGFLRVDGGTLTFRGTSTSAPVTIAALAALTDTGNLSNTAAVSNAGLFTVNANDTIGAYTQNGSGILAGSAALTATGGATLNGGRISGHLLGDTTSTGTVRIETGGTVGGGYLHVGSGMLTLNGTAGSNTTVFAGATLNGTGTINGDLANSGTLAVGSMGNKLTISGNLMTDGKVDLALNSPAAFEQIKAGSVSLGGELVVTNTGAGLAHNEVATIIDAGLYVNGFTTFNPVGFTNGVLFNGDTGMLIGLAGGAPLAGGYLNLTGSQTNVYLSLFEDAVQPGVRNVTRVGDTVIFASGISNGDPQLVRALNQATFTMTPGSIDINTVNTLSPEVHRGMADYTEQSLRSHVRQAVDAAPVARNGGTQVFATLHMESAGLDNSITAAGYDTEMYGVTAGMRYDIDRNFQLGGLFGMDGGNISGTLIDTDAQGFVLGAFGRYFLRNPLKTVFTASATYGGYSYDASRRSFGGLANADSIGSDAFELALGVNTVVYERDGFVVAPSAGFRYMTGSVDGFVERGTGVGLVVASQDIDSFLFDIGVDFSYQVEKRLSLVGRIGYIFDVSDSDETVSASFAATGPNGLPFSVYAPGFDNQGFTLGLGAYYDINDSTRVGLTYNGEFRTDSNSSHTIGVGVSYGF
ncbi:MAG: autotransporter domain-containing protein [Akkermansiaceae bacterium]|nr:autotransporter domain-containing protein [Akkermansiaceae bacterium]